MTCKCVYEKNGECRRFPLVNIVVLGKPTWVFPPAEDECGEKKAKKETKVAEKKGKKKAVTDEVDVSEK